MEEHPIVIKRIRRESCGFSERISKFIAHYDSLGIAKGHVIEIATHNNGPLN